MVIMGPSNLVNQVIFFLFLSRVLHTFENQQLILVSSLAMYSSILERGIGGSGKLMLGFEWAIYLILHLLSLTYSWYKFI